MMQPMMSPQEDRPRKRRQPAPPEQLDLPMEISKVGHPNAVQSFVRDYALFVGMGLFAALVTLVTYLSAHAH